MGKILTEYREEAKKRIIQAGLEVLYEKGYCNTTMDEIALKLKVTKPALYRYFKNKDELIIESAIGRHKDLRDLLSPEKKPVCPVESWIDIFDRIMVSDRGMQSLYFDIISMSYRKEELNAYSCGKMEEEVRSTTAEIEEWQRKGDIPPHMDPHTLSLTLIALFNGMRMELLLGIDREKLKYTWITNLHRLFFMNGGGASSKCQECRWRPDCVRISSSSVD